MTESTDMVEFLTSDTQLAILTNETSCQGYPAYLTEKYYHPHFVENLESRIRSI